MAEKGKSSIVAFSQKLFVFKDQGLCLSDAIMDTTEVARDFFYKDLFAFSIKVGTSNALGCWSFLPFWIRDKNREYFNESIGMEVNIIGNCNPNIRTMDLFRLS